MGNSHLRGKKRGGGRDSGWDLPKGARLAERDPTQALGLVRRRRDRLQPPPPLLREGAGAPKRRGPSGEERKEREAGRANPAQELGGAIHLCSRPAEPEWSGSLAAPTRRSGHAPTPPPSSQLLLELQLLHHRRAQPGNHDGRAVRALTHLPLFSPPPLALLPKRRWPHWEEKLRTHVRPLGEEEPGREPGRGRRAPRVRRGVIGGR